MTELGGTHQVLLSGHRDCLVDKASQGQPGRCASRGNGARTPSGFAGANRAGNLPRGRASITGGLPGYAKKPARVPRHLPARYSFSDLAFRVVGTGSVGLRNYLILLRGNGNEELILQAKQAVRRGLPPSQQKAGAVPSAIPARPCEPIGRDLRAGVLHMSFRAAWSKSSSSSSALTLISTASSPSAVHESGNGNSANMLGGLAVGPHRLLRSVPCTCFPKHCPHGRPRSG